MDALKLLDSLMERKDRKTPMEPTNGTNEEYSMARLNHSLTALDIANEEDNMEVVGEEEKKAPVETTNEEQKQTLISIADSLLKGDDHSFFVGFQKYPNDVDKALMWDTALALILATNVMAVYTNDIEAQKAGVWLIHYMTHDGRIQQAINQGEDFKGNIMHICQDESMGPKTLAFSCKSHVVLLLAMQKFPNDIWIHSYGCQALVDMCMSKINRDNFLSVEHQRWMFDAVVNSWQCFGGSNTPDIERIRLSAAIMSWIYSCVHPVCIMMSTSCLSTFVFLYHSRRSKVLGRFLFSCVFLCAPPMLVYVASKRAYLSYY